MPEGPLTITADWYDARYFETGERYGCAEHGYRNYRQSVWEGIEPILRSVAEALGLERPRFLDVGCGCGQWVEVAARLGWDAWGIDFSPWCVENSRVPERVRLAGAAAIPFDAGAFDLVAGFDVLEHLYFDEVETALTEMRRVSARWVFLNIGGVVDERGRQNERATAKLAGRFVAERGIDPASLSEPERLQLLSGHVTVLPCREWRRLLARFGRLREDLVADFRRRMQPRDKRPPEPSFLENWTCVAVLQKVASERVSE